MELLYESFFSFLLEETYIPSVYRSKTYNIDRDVFKTLVYHNGKKFCLTYEGKGKVDDYLRLVADPGLDITVPSICQQLTMLSYVPREQRIVISDAVSADKVGKLGSYFGDRDYLNLFSDMSIGTYEFQYSGDYEEFVVSRNFPKDVIAKKYLCYLSSTVTTSAIDKPLNSALLRLEELSTVLDSSRKYIINEDLGGIVSCYCVLNDIKYLSWASDFHGSRLYNLGVVTSLFPLITNHDHYKAKQQYYLRYKIGPSKCLEDNLVKSFLKKYIYVYYYPSTPYGIPLFPNQLYVIIDDLVKKKPGRYKLAGQVSTNDLDLANLVKDRVNSVFKRYREVVFSSVYPIDKSAVNFAKNTGLKISDNVKTASCILAMTKGSILRYVKDIENEELLTKILYLPTWSYPFRISNKFNYGKRYGKYLRENFGAGEYYWEHSYENIDYEKHVYEDDYVLYEGVICIPGSRLSAVTRLRLRPEDRKRFNNQIEISVYMLSSMNIRGVVYGMYAEITNSRPRTFV